MASDKDKTGIHEEARGYVGRSPFFDTTKGGRSRIKFSTYCGENKPEIGKHHILRHCIAYDALAEKLKELKSGMFFTGYGWLSRETLKDEFGHFVIKDGQPELVDHLILWRGEFREHEKVVIEQLPLEKELARTG